MAGRPCLGSVCDEARPGGLFRPVEYYRNSLSRTIKGLEWQSQGYMNYGSPASLWTRRQTRYLGTDKSLAGRSDIGVTCTLFVLLWAIQ